MVQLRKIPFLLLPFLFVPLTSMTQLKPVISLLGGPGYGKLETEVTLIDGFGPALQRHFQARVELYGNKDWAVHGGLSVFRNASKFANGYTNDQDESFDLFLQADYVGFAIGGARKIPLVKDLWLNLFLQTRLAGLVQERFLVPDLPQGDPDREIVPDFFTDFYMDLNPGLALYVPVVEKVGILLQVSGAYQVNSSFSGNLGNGVFIGGYLSGGLFVSP